jgi:hypothetical protein
MVSEVLMIRRIDRRTLAAAALGLVLVAAGCQSGAQRPVPYTCPFQKLVVTNHDTAHPMKVSPVVRLNGQDTPMNPGTTMIPAYTDATKPPPSATFTYSGMADSVIVSCQAQRTPPQTGNYDQQANPYTFGAPDSTTSHDLSVHVSGYDQSSDVYTLAYSWN